MKNPFASRAKNIRLKTAELPEVNYLMSIDNDNPATLSFAGKICLADNEVAARCLVDKTHRVATSEEIDAYTKLMLKRKEEIAEKRLAERANFNVNVTVPAQVEKKGK